MIDRKKYLVDAVGEIGITLTDVMAEQFLEYYEMLVEKNKYMNLTAITEFKEVVEKHFVDSLFLKDVYKLNDDLSLIDMGTGAGFPGIPLKIVYPGLNVTLVDSLKKRIRFLEEIIRKLKFEKISTVHARAEELARNDYYRENYDLCVSRAVANLSVLEEYCLPFVKIGGKFISYKSADINDEVEESKHACALLGGKLMDIHYFNLPGSNSKRSFIVIEKIGKIPKKYPRKAGIPLKTPLK